MTREEALFFLGEDYRNDGVATIGVYTEGGSEMNDTDLKNIIAMTGMESFHGRETTATSMPSNVFIDGKPKYYPPGTVIEQTEELCTRCGGIDSDQCTNCKGAKYFVTKRVTRIEL